MTNKERLELAAKAASYDLITHTGYDEDNGVHITHTWIRVDGRLVEWNPLEDDGDAFRLAVKLRLLIQFTNSTVIVCDSEGNQMYMGGLRDAPYEATLRAIVRAAAEIGKGMK